MAMRFGKGLKLSRQRSLSFDQTRRSAAPTMSTSHLRLLDVADCSVDEPMGPLPPGSRVTTGARRVDPVTGFWQTYAETTGWQSTDSLADTDLRGAVEDATNDDSLVDSGTGVPRGGKMLSTSGARRLAEAAAKLAGHLGQQQRQIEAYHAGLAINAAAATQSASHSAGLVTAQRIEQILADTTEACGCVAAHIDLLDDDTDHLTTRFVFGLAPTGRLGRVRPLRGARGDLEAMVGGLVKYENRAACPIDVDSAPEDFASSVCVALGGDDMPIGTFWLHSSSAAAFNSGQVAAARIGGQLISRCLQTQPVRATPQPTPTQPTLAVIDPEPADSLADQIGAWQTATRPAGTCLARGWHVTGGGHSGAAVEDHWTHWDVLPDGTLAIAVARGGCGDAGGLMNTALARAALIAHAGYRHRPADALMRVNDTLLQIDPMAAPSRCETLLDPGQPPSRGPVGVAMVYAHVDPVDGRTRIASVGQWEILVRSRRGYRPIPGPATSDGLGSDVELRCGRGETTLQPGESLVIVAADGSPATLTLGSRVAEALNDGAALAQAVQGQIGKSAAWAGLQLNRAEIAESIRRRPR